MQPLTTKEFNYICDMLEAEELLVRTCAAAEEIATQADVSQFLQHVTGSHQRRHDELLHLLEQHERLAH